MCATAQTASDLVEWFCGHQGVLDKSSVGIVDFPGHGRGAIALKNIPDEHTLFSLRRDLTLSTRTSALPMLMGKGWKEHGLHEGWVGLILCMMWEESRGAESKWSGYLATLPETFDTPMFWSEDDIKELKATAVVDKIGRADAERVYHAKLIPAIKSRPDLFPEKAWAQYFSLDRYHITGSRILSRSFHVEPWKGVSGDEEGETHEPADDNAMEVDVQQTSDTDIESVIQEHTHESNPGIAEAEDDDSDEEDGEDPADVAMVPIADMLNARFESGNAKLFYEERELKLLSTRPIKAGEQIWNTYGDPPNSDLLRRYGHVDLIPLQSPLSGLGNPSDVVEVPANLVASAVSKKVSYDLQERIDWWLEEAEDDVFVLRTDCTLPDDFVSFERLLLLSSEEWEKTAKKGKLPKARPDKNALTISIDVLEKRLSEYPTSLEEDEKLLEPGSVEQLALNKKHACIVRLGEKRILKGTLESLRTQILAAQDERKKRGRDREEEKGMKGKKARR